MSLGKIVLVFSFGVMLFFFFFFLSSLLSYFGCSLGLLFNGQGSQATKMPSVTVCNVVLCLTLIIQASFWLLSVSAPNTPNVSLETNLNMAVSRQWLVLGVNLVFTVFPGDDASVMSCRADKLCTLLFEGRRCVVFDVCRKLQNCAWMVGLNRVGMEVY